MASYLHDMDALQYWNGKSDDIQGLELERRRDEAQLALETLGAFHSGLPAFELSLDSVEGLPRVYLASKQYLFRSFMCIADAVAFLHQNNVRHKDLKPSQILISPQGLWLTDFGWSMDMSLYSHSTTNNGEYMTVRYQAPERAERQPCSRSEDIFTLGCTFLEMALRLADNSAIILDSWQSKTGEKWSFQACLHKLPMWAMPLHSMTAGRLENLACIISMMMRWGCHRRPSIEKVLLDMSDFVFDDESQYRRYFHNSCCPPRMFDVLQGTLLEEEYPDSDGCDQRPWLEPINTSADLRTQILECSDQDRKSILNHLPILNQIKLRVLGERGYLSHAAFQSAWSDTMDKVFEIQHAHHLPSDSVLSQLFEAKIGFWEAYAHVSEMQRRRLFWEAADGLTSISEDTLQYHQRSQAMQSPAYFDHLGSTSPLIRPQVGSYDSSFFSQDVFEETSSGDFDLHAFFQPALPEDLMRKRTLQEYIYQFSEIPMSLNHPGSRVLSDAAVVVRRSPSRNSTNVEKFARHPAARTPEEENYDRFIQNMMESPQEIEQNDEGLVMEDMRRSYSYFSDSTESQQSGMPIDLESTAAAQT